MSIHQSVQDGLETWTRDLRAACGHFDTELAYNRSLFIGEVSECSRGGLSLANLRTNAGLIKRDKPNADHDNEQDCFLVSQRSGYCQITQYGQSIQLAPGDLLLMDSAGSIEISPFGLIEHVSVSLSRNEVCKQLGSQSRTFGKISSSKACGRMLHVLVDQLCKDAWVGEGAVGEGEALQSAFVSLLGSAFDQDQVSGDDVTSLQGNNLRSYVQKVIDESLTQPGLSPVGLANRLNISVRHLYRLFEEQDDSVCRYIQRARLKRSADDLTNPFLRSESITSIAYKWGFTDSAHFSRSFKKQFELSPKDFRSSHLQQAVGAA
ncbi:AraC family transcriptional activator of tynA and feaB [Pseudomonas sp. PvR086]|uniref:AraC-like DNA-binding protein n=2 Tax=Pseudomonas TaxID=286 RepID=A0ACC5MCR2_9PSED|nr:MULTISPECIES: transcriptional regulator FeaR [Pseudomonas]HJR27598.1 transcriptional regulator FeaR [Pseudomonas sp.]ATE77995.1 transcriptional regulator FeaR [Pseudomonas frederiksbergensis]MBB2886444.1 AraC-like DNA-binding protein [Pseudomonas umsongensis]MBD9606844.1 transcriptional regulator FeaR [Pseudomonas sp. PDM08]MDR7104324.1 AraC-like DNA-binding protein [Pseudomonas frederiksbergensis]